MLKVTKNITLTGVSEIEGKQVAYMSATISTDGTGQANVVKNITNQALYEQNKKAVRKDMSDFEVKVYEVEDNLNMEVQNNGKEK